MGRSSVLLGARGGSRLIPPLVDPEGSLLPQLGGRDGDVPPLEQLLAHLGHHCHIAWSDQIPGCAWQGSIRTGNSCQFPTCARNQRASWASRSCSAASRSCGMTVGASPEKSKPHGPGAEPREEVSLGWHIVQDVLQVASGLRGDGDPGGLIGKCSELRRLAADRGRAAEHRCRRRGRARQQVTDGERVGLSSRAPGSRASQPAWSSGRVPVRVPKLTACLSPRRLREVSQEPYGRSS